MDELIQLLHKGNYSCVIANHKEIRTFNRKGVIDLYDLLVSEPNFLCGARVADKVVGKGAAALMALGKVSSLYTDVVSTPALTLLQKYGIDVKYSTETPFIWNRDHTGHCPVETLCEGIENVDDMWPLIHKFVQNMKNKKG